MHCIPVRVTCKLLSHVQTGIITIIAYIVHTATSEHHSLTSHRPS